MVFWHYLDKTAKLKKHFCGNHEHSSFFDLEKLLKLFPNIVQIEYFNGKLKRKNNSNKKTITKIINYILNNDIIIFTDLKYIIIHHTLISPLPNYNNNKYWNIFVDKEKIILYRNTTNIDSINVRFDKINQGNASQYMITNLL